MKNLLKMSDLSPAELTHILDVADQLKADCKAGRTEPLLAGKSVALLFSKASTRTRTSFEVGVYQMGGLGNYMNTAELQAGRGEPLRDTARVLYLLYFLITTVLVGMLLLGGMPLFDSLVHAFGTVGTGGFGIKADSIASYSPYIQGVITVFMILCGINFNLYYLLLLRQWRSVLRSDELWTYLGLVVVATGVITLDLRGVYGGLGTCLRQAAFQVGSVITTTGYATADFNVWPGLSRAILFALMFIGGCAGSTAGGLKVSRAMILLRTIRREINRLVHPRRVTAVRCDGKALGSEVQRGVSIYFALYCLCILVAFLCLSGEPFTLETNLSAVVSCFNNVGPGLGAVGPAGSYADYSVLSKLLLSMAMLMGRLEIYPMLVALSPSVWRKD